MNQNLYYWKMCCCGVFTFEEAVELTKRRKPDHRVEEFKIESSNAVAGYYNVTWFSRPIEHP